MSVNFSTHRQKLLDAYNDVLNEKSDTDWALFSYEGNNNDLKVQSTGDEGLDELESEFNSGKIMYAFVVVDDPNTKLKKYVLIVWQGDGVPATRKGACANHVKDINRFFKGSHVTIYARNEDDVAPDEIMRQVMKTTSNFSFVAPRETQSSQPAPVGSVYKKTNPEQEIKASKNTNFWSKVQKEEQSRKEDEKRREAEKREKEVLEAKEREAKSEEYRSKIVKAREQEISEKLKAQKLAQSQDELRAQEKKKWEEQEAEKQAELERKRDMSNRKAQEAEELSSQRENNPRAMWTQQEKQPPQIQPPARKPAAGGGRVVQPVEQQPPPVPEPSYAPEPTYETAPEPAPTYDSAPEPEPTYETAPEPETSYEPESTYDAVSEPINQPEPDDYQPPKDQGGYGDQSQVYELEDTEPPEEQASDASAGLRARAMFDYSADDDTEISFDPDDIITNIEQIDEGWWRGQAPNGAYGLFPANFVELIE